MSRKKKSKKRRHKSRELFSVFVLTFVFLSVSGVSLYHLVNANSQDEPIFFPVDPNVGIRAIVEEFFNDNGAPEMISIVKCESQFKHYNKDGSVLKNRSGSSAIGVTQILSSVHPDPKVLSLYNKRFNTNLTSEDFDIATLEGNLGYSLMLYKLRGTRDWECSKKFRFN